ncbi:hypothetical protein K438DRAFT_2063722 [Mycena galopus ATCC 62051]|nr:hypothetical protein K438DRAFT_2063722 [Mycena galopus ATCC 62051]
MPRFSASLLLVVLATSFLTANAAPILAARANANNNADFQTACDNGATAGALVGTALTALGEIQTNDQTVASQLTTMKAILEATSTAGGQVAAACQAGGIVVNANNNNNNNQNANNNENANNNQNQNATQNQKANQTATQASNNAQNTAAAKATTQANNAAKTTSTSSRCSAEDVITVIVMDFGRVWVGKARCIIETLKRLAVSPVFLCVFRWN